MESRAQELADETRVLKRKVIRTVSRDGVIDDEEMEVLQNLNELEHSYDEHAEDEAFAIAMMRLGRQMFTDPDAA